MKINKGNAGYIEKRKKTAIIKVVLEFGIVIALLILGYWQTKTRLNMLTMVAVLGCLPASKALVELIMIFPHHSVKKEMADEIENKAELLTTAYDLVLTSEKNIMPIDCVVISDNTICGYTSSEKTDTAFAAKHIKQILYANQFTKVSVKIFDSYTAFVSRVEGMHNIAAVEKADHKKKEDSIRKIILNISL